MSAEERARALVILADSERNIDICGSHTHLRMLFPSLVRWEPMVQETDRERENITTSGCPRTGWLELNALSLVHLLLQNVEKYCIASVRLTSPTTTDNKIGPWSQVLTTWGQWSITDGHFRDIYCISVCHWSSH